MVWLCHPRRARRRLSERGEDFTGEIGAGGSLPDGRALSLVPISRVKCSSLPDYLPLSLRGWVCESGEQPLTIFQPAKMLLLRRSDGSLRGKRSERNGDKGNRARARERSYALAFRAKRDSRFPLLAPATQATPTAEEKVSSYFPRRPSAPREICLQATNIDSDYDTELASCANQLN